MEKIDDDEIEIDLLEIFAVLRSRFLTILLVGVIAASLVGLGTMFLITPKYESSSEMYIMGQNSLSSSLTSALTAGSQLAQDYIEIIESQSVMEKVIENLELDMTYEDLLNIVTLESVTNTRIVKITVISDDPYMAKEIVDEINKVATSRIVDIMGVEEPTTMEYGYLASEPCSPDLKKIIAIAGVAGILLASGVIIALHLLDDSIKTQEDVEKYLGLNNLGMIPVEEGAREQMQRDKLNRRRGRHSFFEKLVQVKMR